MESRLRGKNRAETKSDFTAVYPVFLHLLIKSFSNSPAVWLHSLSHVYAQPQGQSASHHWDPCGCVRKVMLAAGTTGTLPSAAGTAEDPKFQILKNPKGYQAVPYMDNSGHTYHRLKPGQCLSQAAAAPGSQEGRCVIFTPKFISFLVLSNPFYPRHPCPLQERGGRELTQGSPNLTIYTHTGI